MTDLSAGSPAIVRIATPCRRLIVALCAFAFAIFYSHGAPAQQISYPDFNGPATAPTSQTSIACLTNSAPTGVLFCFNSGAGTAGVSFVQDTYPPSVDPNAGTDGGLGSTNFALQVTESAESQDSSVWYAVPQDVADGFTVWYAFRIVTPGYPPGDGLAFVIQNALGSGASDPDPYFSMTNSVEAGSGLTVIGASGGGSLGYGGIDNSIALEADTFPDSYDPWDNGEFEYIDNHMALQSCGLDGGGIPIQNSPAHYLSNTATYPSYTATSCLVVLNGSGAVASNPHSSSTGSTVTVNDGSPHQVVVVYNGPNDSPANYLSVYLDPAFNPGTHTPAAGSTPLFAGSFNITQHINLSGPSNNSAYLGFTAATGEGSEQHEVMGFSFMSHTAVYANVCPGGQSTPAPCSATNPVNFNIAAGTTIGSVQVVTQGAAGYDFQDAVNGDSCVGTFSTAGSCTVNVTFAPLAPGLRMGAVNLVNGGTVVATQLISGIGQGPQATFSPLTTFVQNSGGNSLNAPMGVAVDVANNVFIADTGNKRVLKVTGNSSQIVATQLSRPQGVAVDGAGNLYVADSALGVTGEVLKLAPGCTNSSCWSVLYTAQGPHPGPFSVAVDGSDNVFIADNPNGVFEIPANGSGQTLLYNPTNSQPTGVAADATGDLFISDSGLHQVVELPANCGGCQKTVGLGWANPASVAVDAAGDVIVADTGVDEVIEVPVGCTIQACQIIMAFPAFPSLADNFQPFDAVPDSQGDIYIADVANNRIDVTLAGNQAFNFAESSVGNQSGDGARTVLFQNIGNQALTSAGQGLVLTDPNFSQAFGTGDPGTPADCTASFSLSPGAACNLSATFTPLITGTATGYADFYDNNLNNLASIQAFPFTGTGVSNGIEYSLTVANGGPGSGTVTDNLTAINCILSGGSTSGTCSGSYESGVPVTLTATPVVGTSFLGWGGACASSGTSSTCTVSMTGAMNVTAQFGQPSLGNINVCTLGGVGQPPCSSTQQVTFTATATVQNADIQVVTQGTGGLDFTRGSTTCGGTILAGNSCTITVNFAPKAPGLRLGAVEISGFANSVNGLVASIPVSGIGQAPEIAYTPASPAAVILGGGYSLSQPVAVDAASNIYFAATGQAYEKTSFGVQTLPSAGQFYGARSIAVDGAGDVFVADNDRGQVFELPANGGAQTTVYPPLDTNGVPSGVAVDGKGDLFVADSYQNEVVEISADGGSNTVLYGPISSGASVNSVAVDAAGDVFVALTFPGSVIEIPAGCTSNSCQIPVGTGWNDPAALALDAAGNLYVADPELASGNGEIVQVTPRCSSAACQYVLANGNTISGGVNAFSLALDGQGNVYYVNVGSNEHGAGSGIAQLVEIAQSQVPSLNFGATTAAGTSSSPLPVTLQNIGNQPLSVGVFSVGSPFAQIFNGNDNPADCTNSGNFSLSPAQSCTASITFNPPAGQFYSADVEFTDDSLNTDFAPFQQIALGGTGTGGVVNFSLSVSTAGAGSGSIGGTNCTTGNYSTGTSVICTENPGGGSQFTGWSGGTCSGTGSCSFTLTANSTVVANFSLTLSYALNVTEIGTGTGTVTSSDTSITCTSGSSNGCSASYPSTTSVMLRAAATGTSTFLGWGGACASSGTSAHCIVTMNAAENVTASFSQQSFGSVSVCAGGIPSAQCIAKVLAVTFNLSTDTTIGSVQVVTQGATGLDFSLSVGSGCSGFIAAGNSCTVNVNFAPLAPGLRMGAVELLDNNGNLLASAPVYGIGQAAEAAFSPAPQTTVPGTGLNQPYGLAVDAAGDTFIGEPGVNLVLKVAPGGAQSTVGTFTGHPYGLAVDGAGDVFIAELNSNRVDEVTPSGVQTVVPATGLTQPIAVAVDGAGDLFISDRNNSRVVELPAGCTTGSCQITLPTVGLGQPYGLALDAAGDVFIADFNNNQVIKVTPGGGQTTVPTTGLNNPYGVAVDTAGDVYIVSFTDERVIEVTPSGVQTTVAASGLSGPSGLALDGAGDLFISDYNNNRVVELERPQTTSLGFALTNQGSTSADSPQFVSLQNVGNQSLTGGVTPTSTTNFLENMGSTCGSAFSLVPAAVCDESFSFAPQTTGYLTDAAFFSDNTLNLASSVVAQAVNLSGVGDLPGQSGGVIVPNVVGMTQTAATSALTGAGLALGSVSSEYSSGEPAGSVIGENPAAGSQVSAGSAVKVLLSIGEAPPPSPTPLTFENNYFVTGDYATGGVSFYGVTAQNGLVSGAINIPAGTSNGVPTGADIIDAFLYWTTLENTATASGGSGTFLGYSIAGQQIGSDQAKYTDGAFTGTLRAYRADVNTYLPNGANGVRLGSGSFNVALPEGSNALPLTEGASLVVIYRALVPPNSANPPSLPLKSVVIYDGLTVPSASGSQNIQGFYDAAGPFGNITTLSTAPGNLTIGNSSAPLAAGASQYAAPLSAGAASFAVILSTPVVNSDNDGILDAWKAGPASTSDFFHGQPGYYDVKTQSWVPLPGAKHGQQDLFVQFDWMCGAVDSNGVCSGEDLYPSPDSDGNDPLAIVQQAFLNTGTNGIHLHLEVGNAVPETTCNDATAPQLCQFPGEPGVIGWKNSLEFSKIWPRSFTTCAAGGDCTARFPFGQKDSYHYVLFGHSLAIPAWNSRYGSLVSITVSGPATTIVTTDRGNGINACPNRITISGVLGNPGLNGVYTTTGCADTKTMSIATPSGATNNWSYPGGALPEPVIGITSGTVTSISGYSDLGGADSAVTLALWETAPNQDMSKRANVIAGTLYHEIGHTLGLTHGGLYYQTPGSYVPTFDVNCKPNYQSSMNYLFQLDGVGPNAAVAYSNQTLETLNDATGLTGLTQLTDINNLAPTFSTSAWYSPTAPSTTASAATLHCDGTPLNGDTGYRIDGSISPITPSWTNNQNIAFDGVTYSQLLGYNDVSNIDLRQVGATGGEFASLAGILSFGNSATPLTVPAGGNVSLGSGGTVALGSGGNVTLGSGGNVTLGSGGTITPGSNGTVTLNNGGSATLSTGGTITVGASGGTVTLGGGGVIALGSGATIGYGNSGGNVTLGSGGNVTLGSGGTIALGSGGSVTIPSTGGAYAIDSSGGTIMLGSGGTVALGSGGNVMLGSGGTIALGSGGNVTLGSGGLVALGSGGTIALGSGGTVALGSGGNVTLGSGGLVALGSGGNVTLGSGGNVTLGSGGLVTLGSGGDVSVGAGGNVTLGSGGTVTLGSGGNVTLGSGGNVTLGSGGTIALGSGGTIALGSGGVVALGSGGLVTLGSGGTITSSNGIAVIGAGGSYTLPAGGGTIALGSGGNITLGSGGNVTLGSGGNVTLGSGGTITMGSGGTVTLGSGGNVTLGSGGVVALGSGGNVTLGSGGTIALGSGGNVTLGSGGVTSTELDYDTANSIVRPPPLASETPTPIGVRVNWIPPTFGVVNTYTVLRSSDGQPPIVVGSVSGVNGFAPSTAFTDSNPDTTSQTVTYTITTTLVPDTGTSMQRSSLPSPPAVQTNDQTIVLGTLPNSVALPGPQTITATAESNGTPNGLEVSFSTSGTACTIGSQSILDGVSSASVTLNSTGSCTVTASQPGTNLSQSGDLLNYNAATPVSGTFAIQAQGSNLQTQTINFPVLPNIQYGSTFLLSATASSGETVTFGASGPCGINGATTGVGVCVITASVPGDTTYSGASLSQSFTIYPAVITVTATNLMGTYGQALPALTYSLSPTVNGDPSTVITGTPALSTTATSTSSAGPYTIAVSTGSLAAQNYSFLFVNGTLTIQPAGQTISFTTQAPSTEVYKGMFPVVATSTSGLPVWLTVDAGSTLVCSLSSGMVTMNTGTGTCTIDANQAGNTNYNIATQVQTSAAAAKAAPTVSWSTAPPLSAAYNSHFTVVASTNSTGAIAYSATGGCTNLLGVVTMNSGTTACLVSAGAVADSNYTAGSVGPTSVTASLAGQTISFTTPAPSTEIYRGAFPVVATSTSGLPVSLMVDFGSTLVCSLSSGMVTMNTGTGTCTIDATQAGNGNYNPATQATTSAAATKAAPTVSWSMAPPLSAAYNSHFTVVASSNSTGAITYSATGGCTNLLGVVTMTSGTTACLVSAGAATDANYAAGSVGPTSVTAAMLAQAITFTINPPATAAYNSSFSVAATGGASGNLVTFSNSGACSNSGATYTMTNSTGTCSVIANQLGNANYAAAPTVIKSVTAAGPLVTVSPSSINFGAVNLGSVTIQTVTVSNIGTAAATISTPLLSLLQAGNSDEYVIVNLCPSSLAAGKTCTVAVSFVAGAYYNTAQTATLKIMDNAPGSPQQVALSATVLEPQTIAFTANPPASAVYNSTFTVAAAGGGSENAVTFTSSGSCSNSGAKFTMISGTGTCSVIANQAGNSTYAAAAQVTKTVSATLAAQAITFTTNAPSSAVYKSSFSVVALASSGLAVTYASSGACSNSGATYTMTSGTGSCTVKANQAGNSNYSAAAQVTQTVTLTLATQAITFTTNAPSSAVYESSFTVAATGGASGNAVTYSSSGSCSNSGAKYTMTKGTGTCSVIANQAGTANAYSAAPQVTETVSATYAVATLGPASLSFGTVSSGKSSTPQTATLKNTGTTPLIISSIGFTGTNPGNFAQTSNCPSSSSSLAAGGSCTISVTFNSGGKAVTANLSVTDNTQAGAQTVSLSGN